MTYRKSKQFGRLVTMIAAFGATDLWAQTIQSGGSSSSETTGAPAVVLPSFEVNDTSDKGYLAANSVSATRINTAIIDLPFAVSAFTPQFMNDIGARDLYDVVKYSSGVQSGSSEFLAGDTDFSIRGFKQFPEHDGFYESANGNIYVDTVDVERVEVVKGPSALLYGAIAPGGTVNYLTKKAQPGAFITLNGQYGSYSFGRATIDINQPIIGKTLLFRFNAALENGYEWVHQPDGTPTTGKTTVLDPTITWNILPNTSLRVNYQYFYRKERPTAYPIPQIEIATPASEVSSLTPGNAGPTAALTGKTGIDIAEGYGSDSSNPGFLEYYPRWPNNQNYLSDSDSRTTNLQSFDAEFDTGIGMHWKSRVNFNYSHVYQTETIIGQSQIYLAPPNSLVYGNGTWSVAPAFNALSSAQQIAAELAFAQAVVANAGASLATQNGVEAPGIIPKVPEFVWDKVNTDTLQWETAGDYEFSWGKLKPLAGVFYDASGKYSYTVQNLGGAASPYMRNWDVNPASPTYYINDRTAVNVPALTSISTNTLAWTSDQAAYGVINASLLHDTLYFVGGARYNRSESQTTNYIAPTGTAPVGQGYRAHYTTPQAGLGYKVVKDLMIYASYSTAYSLPSTSFLSTIQTVNGVLKSVPTTQAVPTTANSYEMGAKTDFLNGRVSSTLSVYEIKQSNVVQTVNSFIAGTTLATSVQQTQVESKGVEYEITLSPTDNWQIFASASEDDARNVAEPPGYTYYLGEPPPYSSKTLANLWTRYSFVNPLKGLWIGGGFNYQGRLQGDTANAADYFPAALIWNASAGYDWTWGKTKMDVTINGENLGNKFYVPATQERALPRRVVFSVSATF